MTRPLPPTHATADGLPGGGAILPPIPSDAAFDYRAIACSVPRASAGREGDTSERRSPKPAGMDRPTRGLMFDPGVAARVGTRAVRTGCASLGNARQRRAP